ncbi:hypothetical protein BSKO_06404 [Bryopsis sp. KO-2023]|nr:hypothetical protein BSKO_06404 [Bryopsis sp. KO-2023]
MVVFKAVIPAPRFHPLRRKPLPRPPSAAAFTDETVALSQAQSKVAADPAWRSTGEDGNEGPEYLGKYLAGNFTPVRELSCGATSEGFIVLEGAIPEGLRGLLIRNGPNPDRTPNVDTYHLFDGDGMIHAVHLGGGSDGVRLTYKNKFVNTLSRKMDELIAPNRKGTIFPGIDEIPFKIPQAMGLSLLSKAVPASLFRLKQDSGAWGDTPLSVIVKNSANTNLVYHHGKLLALWEVGFPYELDVSTLDTVGPYTFKGGLKSSFSAHPKVDPVDGSMVDVSYSFPEAPHCRTRVWSKEGNLLHEAIIESMEAVFMHDCAITEHYTLIVNLPLLLNLPFGPTSEGGFDRTKSAIFKPERGGKIGVMPRFGTEKDLRWFEVSPNFSFHTVNAYEEGNKVILHACRMQEAIPNWDPFSVREGIPTLVHEYVLDMETGKATERSVHSSGQSLDMPCLHPAYVGKKARFTFAGGDSCPQDHHPINSYEKVDLLSDSPPLVYKLPEGCYGSTFTFAPRRSSASSFDGLSDREDFSDDGWLLVFVHSEVTGFSELHVVDGCDMEMVARVHLPSRVPYGFHCVFIPEDQLPQAYTLA